MPDWSYHPLFRPLLFHLPAERGRDLILGARACRARLPHGPSLIELVGHMRPPEVLERNAWGLTFPTPVGLGAGLDVHALALPALARFSLGFVEAGPVTLAPVSSDQPLEYRAKQQVIWRSAMPANDGVIVLAKQLEQHGTLPVPLGIRLAHRPGADAITAAHERIELIAQLAPYADFWTLSTDAVGGKTGWNSAAWHAHLLHIQQALAADLTPKPLLVCIAPDRDSVDVDMILATAVQFGIAGVVVGGGIDTSNGGRLIGAPTRDRSLALVRSIYAQWGNQITIIAAGGVHQPADACALLDAGATFVQVCSGLVFAGPGLPKRINEALAYRSQPLHQPKSHSALQRSGWFWIALLGLGMIGGGVLAWLVAATRVVLPYDEAFVGLPRAALQQINPRLLPFMAHDRITLAGTMISIGVLYAQLAFWALRDGIHCAWRVVKVSAVVGFASFFLFLGFGYFDPLHALVTTLLLPFLLLGLRREGHTSPHVPQPDLHNDWRWKSAVWGQFLCVGLGVGLTLAGITIALVGMTTVFVPEDIAFLRTTPAALHTINPRLIALIAHDRAGFGGALVSNGLAVLLIALWGVRRGARWVWWTFLLAGIPGFAGAVSVHITVGYTDPWHIAPALLAIVVFVLGLALLYPYVCLGVQHNVVQQPRPVNDVQRGY